MNPLDVTLPPAWRLALARVQQYYPEAVIAGGALRDLLTGRDAKDLDIFIDAHTYLSSELGVPRSIFNVKDNMAQAFGVEPKMVINPEFCDYSQALDGVVFAMEIDTVPLPVQIIALDEPVTMRSAVERIDFGICRVAANGYTFYLHPDFIHDIENECFTLRAVRTAPQLERSKARYERLKEKFSGWPLVAYVEVPVAVDEALLFD